MIKYEVNSSSVCMYVCFCGYAEICGLVYICLQYKKPKDNFRCLLQKVLSIFIFPYLFTQFIYMCRGVLPVCVCISGYHANAWYP